MSDEPYDYNKSILNDASLPVFQDNNKENNTFLSNKREQPDYNQNNMSLSLSNSSNIRDFNLNYSYNINSNSNFLNAKEYYPEAIRDPGKEGRKASDIYFLRTFNNFIKSCLIHNTYKLLGCENICVLDLCCGKGGDVDKFFQKSAKLYVGVDMAATALKIAKQRIEKIKKEKNKKNNCKCFLIEEDLSKSNNLNEKIPKYIKFDIVSCQMALHYHFGNEENLVTFMNNVDFRLNENGYFICTIIDDNVIVKRLRENKEKTGELAFGNKFYSVKFSQDKFSLKEPYGIKYGFFLEDSIDKRNMDGSINYIEEYLIMFENFKRICKEKYNLHLVEKCNFIDYYSKLLQDESTRKVFSKYIKGFDKEDYQLQWEIAHLYQIVIFKKGEVSKSNQGNFNYNYNGKYKEVFKQIQHHIKNSDTVELDLKEFA